MHWGETQSFFQLSAALNLAYFSLREIRAPMLNRLNHEIEKLKNSLPSLLEVKPESLSLLSAEHKSSEPDYDALAREGLIGATFRQLERERDVSLIKIERVEKVASYFSLSIFVLAMYLLIYGTMRGDNPMNEWSFMSYLVVCLLPTLFFLAVNIQYARSFAQSLTFARSMRDRTSLHFRHHHTAAPKNSIKL